MINGDLLERSGDLLDFEDQMVERKKCYMIYTLSPVAVTSTGFQKCKKTVTWKYSSASDIDSVYDPRGSDDRGMLICRFAWRGRPYGRVENGGKKCTRSRQIFRGDVK